MPTTKNDSKCESRLTAQFKLTLGGRLSSKISFTLHSVLGEFHGPL